MEELTEVATNVDETNVGGETVIDFDIAANEDYEVQSCVMVNDENEVVEAAVRFGRVEEQPEIGVGVPILNTAWISMVQETTGLDKLGPTALEADMSDFDHIVPHLRVERENVETYDCETLDLCEFVSSVAELSALVERVFRGDTDNEIDEWL